MIEGQKIFFSLYIDVEKRDDLKSFFEGGVISPNSKFVVYKRIYWYI